MFAYLIFIFYFQVWFKLYFICINISSFNNITRYNILYKWDSEESQQTFFFQKSVSQYCNQSGTYTISDLKIQKYKVDTKV